HSSLCQTFKVLNLKKNNSRTQACASSWIFLSGCKSEDATGGLNQQRAGQQGPDQQADDFDRRGGFDGCAI
ncbi:hypothetical protein ACC771_09540, partial [Rhizobium ruizarguesonis]